MTRPAWQERVTYGQIVCTTLSFSKVRRFIEASNIYEYVLSNCARLVRTFHVKREYPIKQACRRPWTPAMAAGLIDHVWTLRELLTVVLGARYTNTLSGGHLGFVSRKRVGALNERAGERVSSAYRLSHQHRRGRQPEKETAASNRFRSHPHEGVLLIQALNDESDHHSSASAICSLHSISGMAHPYCLSGLSVYTARCVHDQPRSWLSPFPRTLLLAIKARSL